ncbi:ABC transporter permease [Bacillus sp. NPDC077027]|uniref:ABC transporter permease n=1 Tax=Bacillus sp. NPDC077027 TaxID=3390548 RepID=UPI003D0176A3
MNFVKRAFWNLTAHKGRTLLQLFVFTSICLLVLSGLAIQTAAKTSSELAKQALGGSVTLQGKDTEDSVSIKEAEKLANLSQVKSYNFYSSAKANAVHFSVVQDEAHNKPIVSIAGVMSSSGTDAFSHLSTGRSLTNNDVSSKVTVISSKLAEKNEWSVGDTLTVQGKKKVTLQIVGIYQLTNESDAQTANTVYVPYTIANTIKSAKANMIDQAVYRTTNVDQLNHFITSAKKDTDMSQYSLTSDDQLYEQLMKPISNVASFSKKVVYLVTICGAFILTAVMMLFIRGRKYEMGVLMAMGEKRWKLVAQFITETVLIGLIAVLLAALPGGFIANEIGNELLTYEIEKAGQGLIQPIQTGLFNLYSTSQLHVIDSMNIQVTLLDLFHLFSIGTALVICATFMPILSLLHLTPRAILSKH